MIQKGGCYQPDECKARHKVGILVPYRDREANLPVFLYNIHPFLMRQKLEYRIFVIEQKGTDNFNRGRLFNAGYLELKKFGSWDCVVFHDVDLLPLDNRILYSCPTWPRHMCASVVQVTDPKFRTLFGGVSSMKPQAIEKVNGYSNLYWGWGGEDDDMFWRIRYSGYPVVRYNKNISRYTSLPHRPSTPANRLRYFLLSTTRSRYKKEGLSSLEYKVESVTLHHLYTHILVDINPYRENVTELLEKWKSHCNKG
ncbi:beta-1,4-N-acetylgalactosaminyltransferase bre-4-like [Maniola hyperantus]|uniref:beta-1,4-N-acetylgalactosaminyltransferase bre-4-like n=1 Tax=Aphantopus hyperantus TaxID=2795564 RepID=UPI001567CA71|nr:beta-1,4-N-acetylgalactosaminyltransferase bre-4-like [Maniola hyperantus]